LIINIIALPGMLKNAPGERRIDNERMERRVSRMEHDNGLKAAMAHGRLSVFLTVNYIPDLRIISLVGSQRKNIALILFSFNAGLSES
jgi:hypothetical protein